MTMDPYSASLVGHSIWQVACWVESRQQAGEPYEIFTNPNDPERFGYRITVERIPYKEPVALA